MVHLKAGVPTQSLVQQLPELRQSIVNSGIAMTWADGQRYYLLAVERLEGIFSHSLLDGTWYERLYSSGYWVVREMSENTTRPVPLLRTEADRLVRWLDEIEREVKRIADQDEWDAGQVPRLLFDTSALVREGSFDTFDWLTWLNSSEHSVRLIIPILVVREMDDLKNSGKAPKARRRLRRIYSILDHHGRGPTSISGGTTLELLLDPFGHSRAANHDEEIVRRASYLAGRKGGPLTLITGDYTMLFTAQAEGIDARLTPVELMIDIGEKTDKEPEGTVAGLDTDFR